MKNEKRGRIERRLAAAALTGLMAAAGPAAAEEQDAVTLPTLKVPGKAEDYRTKRSSTATKTDTLLRDTPQAVTVISRDAIEDLSMQSMADVVRYVPGVQMGQGEGHRDAPILRGNISTADFFVDGVRDDTQYYRDLYNAERIEVLKGPNAMIFGRGGGGIINRVTKRADGQRRAIVGFEAGAFDFYRGEVDVGTAINDRLAIRVNGMYEDADSCRDYFNLERFGINPTLTYQATDKTQIRISYEYLDDDRTVDRGVPSELGTGRPYRAAGDSQYFGNPDLSFSKAQVHITQAAIEHEFSAALTLSNKTVYATYDKFYQNVYPNGAVSGGSFTLDAYHSGTQRHNLFNQTDLVWKTSTGGIAHTILAGVEVGRQWTDNFRNNTAGGTLSTINPVSVASPVSFAFPASGAFFDSPNSNNHVDTKVLGFYAQDQIKILSWLELLAGIRYDIFDLDFEDHLTSQQLSRKDGLLSPRVGVIVKPIEDVSLYASYSVSHLPQSGDQFSSLSATSASLRPEKFENVEVGVKWDISPALSATLAAYRLDRDNTTAPGPSGTTVLAGSQRSKGIELEIAGEIVKGWQILGGYAYQDAKITSTTSAADAGQRAALVPLHAVSLWNKVEITPWLAVGVGVVSQSEAYAATSKSRTVKLPSYTRLDAALFFKISERVRAQVNIENLLDRAYYSSAHNDNNIMPASPIAVRAAIRASLW